VLNPSLVVPATAGVTLDLHLVPVDGKLTLNGGPLGVGTHCTNAPTDPKVRLTFIDASSAPTFSIWDAWKAPPATSISTDVLCDATDAFSLQIPPGVYRVTTSSVYSNASSMPDGELTAVGRIDLR
jgi:hypothetical protein